jgi:hypothetical protein
MLKTFTALTLAAATAFGATVTTLDQAEAGRGGRVAAGVAAGIIGLGILGAYAHARDRHYHRSSGCYKGPERCSWRGRRCFENRYGDVVCRGGHYSCHRETICD